MRNISGIKGDEDEQPARRSAVANVSKGCLGTWNDGRTEKNYRYSNEDHKNMMVTQERYQP